MVEGAEWGGLRSGLPVRRRQRLTPVPPISRVARTSHSALEAQRAGDWTRYGEELRRLEEVLRQLQVVLGSRD